MNEREIVRAALEQISQDARTAFLEDVCGGDAELRTRVERLIAQGLKSTFVADEPKGVSSTRIANTDSTQDSDAGSGADVRVSAEISISVSEGTTEKFDQQSPTAKRFEGYQLLEVVGRGGMGVVIKAQDLALRRVVAIKTLSPEFVSHPQARGRFLREAQAAAAVRHENIVTIYSVNGSVDLPFLVMEYISGKSLHQRIIDNGPLPIKEIVRIAIQIAAGMSAAHRAGLVHRDIKPANILLEEETRRVKITDFGLARVMSEVGITLSGQVAGTPQFMSPEQAQGQTVDHRSDLFSLGSVMYSMCVADPAFSAETAVAVLRLVCDTQPPSIHSLRKGIPHWLVDVIEKLMSKRPEDRFQSAAEVERVLRARLSTEDLQNPTTFLNLPEIPPIMSPPAKQSRVIAPVLIATLAAMAIAGWTLRHFLTSPNPTRLEPVQNSVSQQPSNSHNEVRPILTTVVNPLLSSEYEWEAPVNLGASVNSPDHDDHACISSDGLTLIFMRSSEGKRMLWESRRLNRDELFGAAAPLPEFINAGGTTEAPYLTSDGLELWFVSSRAGGNDLWISRRPTVDEPFGEPTNLGPPVNTTDIEASPFLTSDGLTLLFARGMPRRIMQATRPKLNEPFDEPRILANVNDSRWSEFPRLTADGLAMIYVMSLVEVQQHLWLTTRKSIADQFESPVSLGSQVNGGVMSGPSLWGDGLTIYFSSNRPGGFGGFDLWSTTRIRKAEPNTTPQGQTNQTLVSKPLLSPSELLASPDYEWSPLENLGEPVNTVGYEAGPAPAADGLSLLFHGNKDRALRTGNLRIWQAWRHSASDPFQTPVLLDDAVNDQPENLSDPTITGDGLTLVFCMRRNDGEGEFDLWLSDRPGGDASWNAPINAGAAVNSDRNEWEPELSADGLTLLFHSDRANQNGGTDLWIARRTARNVPFGVAENLGPEINTADHEGGAALSSDGLTLLYHRFGANGLSHWQATRKTVSDPFVKPRSLIIPGLIESGGHGLSLSAAADRVYCSITHSGAPDIATSRRIPKLAATR